MSPTIHQASGHHEGRTGSTLPSPSGYQAPDQAHAHTVCSTGSPAPAVSAEPFLPTSLPGRASHVGTAATWLEDLQETVVPVRGETTEGVGVGVVEGQSYEKEVIPKYLLVI